MKTQITGLRVASVVFGLFAVGQLMRVLMRPDVIVAGHLLPLWPSVLAVIIFASLSLWLWKLTHIQAS